MIYLANPSTDAIRAAMASNPWLGYIDTPKQGNTPPAGVAWCADNGCFSDRWDSARWWGWLQARAASLDAGACLFAVAPDVVGDAWGTYLRSWKWLRPIRDLGLPVAYVGQNGADRQPPPWHFIDALFVGGAKECAPCRYVWDQPRPAGRREPCPVCGEVLTEWKLGPAAVDLIAEAKRRGLWVHAGRVNSRIRFDFFRDLGCDSADGTYLTFGPDKNLPKLLSWLETNDRPEGSAA